MWGAEGDESFDSRRLDTKERRHRSLGRLLRGMQNGFVFSEPLLRKGTGPAKCALPRRPCCHADAARYLAVSCWTVRQMVWHGNLPHIKTGKRILLDLRNLDGWILREKSPRGLGSPTGASVQQDNVA